ncbi:MAG: hypothetical protein ACXWDH_08745 [Aeromicrobium sp.]
MRAFLAYERRLQDLETRLGNMNRFGEVKDVKFDSEKKRWYVKMEDGEGEGTTFKSDWLPWKSFSHGSIKVSMPPKKGMRISMTAPNGQPEMAFAEPFHYGPDSPSPHDKEDEVVMTIEGEGGTESMRVHQSKGENTITIGDTVFSVKKDSVSVTTKTITLTSEDGKIVLDGSGITLTGSEIKEN